MNHTLEALQVALNNGGLPPQADAAIRDGIRKLTQVNRMYVDMKIKHDLLLTKEAQNLDPRIKAETDSIGGVRFFADHPAGRIVSVSAHMVKAQLDQRGGNLA